MKKIIKGVKEVVDKVTRPRKSRVLGASVTPEVNVKSEAEQVHEQAMIQEARDRN